MKNLIIFLAVVLIIATSFFVYKQGYFGSNHDGQNSLARGEISPVKEWGKLILGEWNYNYDESNEKYHLTHNGIIIFNPDSTFELHINITQDGDAYNEYKDFKAGGTVTGTWSIDSNSHSLIFNSSNCNISIGEARYGAPEVSKLCSFYNFTSIWKGYSTYSQSDLLAFNKDKIMMNGTYLTNKADFAYSMTRKKFQ